MGHLDEYIQEALDEGYSKKDIAKKLLKSGYSKAAVEKALAYHVRPEHALLKISMGLVVIILFLLALFQMNVPTSPEDIPAIFRDAPSPTPRMQEDAAHNTQMLYNQVRDPTVIQLKACMDRCLDFTSAHTKAECEVVSVEQNLVSGVARGRCLPNLGSYRVDGESFSMDAVCSAIVQDNCDSLRGKAKGFCRAFLNPTRCDIDDPAHKINDPKCKKKMQALNAFTQAYDDASVCERLPYLDDRVTCRALIQNSCSAMYNTYTHDIGTVTLNKASGVAVECDLSIPELQQACIGQGNWQAFEQQRLGNAKLT